MPCLTVQRRTASWHVCRHHTTHCCLIVCPVCSCSAGRPLGEGAEADDCQPQGLLPLPSFSLQAGPAGGSTRSPQLTPRMSSHPQLGAARDAVPAVAGDGSPRPASVPALPLGRPTSSAAQADSEQGILKSPRRESKAGSVRSVRFGEPPAAGAMDGSITARSTGNRAGAAAGGQQAPPLMLFNRELSLCSVRGLPAGLSAGSGDAGSAPPGEQAGDIAWDEWVQLHEVPVLAATRAPAGVAAVAEGGSAAAAGGASSGVPRLWALPTPPITLGPLKRRVYCGVRG